MSPAACVLAVLLTSSGPLPLPSANDELRFGIEAAQKGLWNEARFRFERAVALQPGNAKALNDLAVAYEHMGDFEKARKSYERALELKPGDSYIQQNYDLFREADDKRTRKSRRQPTKKP
jgi:Flp pilus assembly protein TadD